MKLFARSPSSADVRWLADNLREEDARELRTASQCEPLEALAGATGSALETYILRTGPDGPPLALIGRMAGHEQYGGVWMVGTPDLQKQARALLRTSLDYLSAWELEHPKGLMTVADSRNTVHTRWLFLLGFVHVGQADIHGTIFNILVRPRKEPVDV